ncbi:MAG: nitrate reductase molybdenum cofactor assembly chaperone [Desulfobacterales bacterium]
MNKNVKFQMKIISLLFQYPDEGFGRSLPLMAGCIEGLPRTSARTKLIRFISILQTTPLIRLQETYTQTFDLNPSTCLNLTYHLLGNAENRGKVMAHLQQIYHDAGYETISGELPDYLPLMLEFLSECPEPAGLNRLRPYLAPVEKLADLLKDSGNPYSSLLDVVRDMVRQRRADDRGRITED